MRSHSGAPTNVLCALAFVLAACGGGSSGPDGDSNGSGGNSAAGSGSSLAGAAGVGGAPIATGGSGGSSGAVGGGATGGGSAGIGGAGGAHAATPSDLFPLAVGNQWTYTTTAKSSPTTCMVGTVMTNVVSTDMQAGRVAFEVTSYCAGLQGAVSLSDRGVDQLDSGTWDTIVSTPVADGASWQTSFTSFTWHGPLSLTVPAGTFNGCWKRSSSTNGFPDVTYCPRVGAVEVDEQTYTTVLTSFTLKTM